MKGFIEILIFLPTVGALIGYVCKWVAIRMLFAPERYIGIGPIGWQGVVQRRAPKFAAGVADTVATAGIAVAPLLERLSGDEAAGQVGPLLDRRADELLRATLEEVKPGAYDGFPEPVRIQLAQQLSQEGRKITVALVEGMRPAIVQALDVKEFIVHQLSGENANRLARLFQRVGRRELEVVIWYGAILGFLIGLLEVGFYAALERWWLLPLIGAIDGLVNNWLAIQMIFRPYEKKNYLGFLPFQGLFPARQQEISREYAHMLAEEVLTPRDVVAFIDGKGREQLLRVANDVVERETATLARMMSMMLGVEVNRELRERVLRALTPTLMTAFEAERPALEAFVKQRLGIADMLEGQLKSLPKEEFERVLRGIFEEDEWILIALGGFLGGLIGLLQGFLVLWLD